MPGQLDSVLTWLTGLPKVELHVHHIGATAPHTIAALARKYPDAGVPCDLDSLETFYAFSDFDHFLQVYAAVSRLLRTPDDIYELTVGNLNASLVSCQAVPLRNVVGSGIS